MNTSAETIRFMHCIGLTSKMRKLRAISFGRSWVHVFNFLHQPPEGHQYRVTDATHLLDDSDRSSQTEVWKGSIAWGAEVVPIQSRYHQTLI